MTHDHDHPDEIEHERPLVVAALKAYDVEATEKETDDLGIIARRLGRSYSSMAHAVSKLADRDESLETLDQLVD